MTIELKKIAEMVGAETVDLPKKIKISGIAPIESAATDQITFLANKKYLRYAGMTNAAAIITSSEFDLPEGKIALIVKNPYEAFIKIVKFFNKRKNSDIASGISDLAFLHDSSTLAEDVSVAPFAYIGENVRIGKGTRIGANVVVMKGSTIGNNCLIYPNVTLMDQTIIGNRVILNAGSVLGGDGFGFIPGQKGLEKIPQTGNVVIEDDVEIGANTCVDRAVTGSTTIKYGTKIDNLVQIGHNVRIGSDSIIVSMAGISGSTVIGDRVTIGGQAGFGQHIRVGDGATVAGQAGVTKNVPENTIVSGYPAKEHMKAIREEIAVRNLPSLKKKIMEQEKRLAKLEESINIK